MSQAEFNFCKGKAKVKRVTRRMTNRQPNISPLNPNYIQTYSLPLHPSRKMVLYGLYATSVIQAINPFYELVIAGLINQTQCDKLTQMWTYHIESKDRPIGCVPKYAFLKWLQPNMFTHVGANQKKCMKFIKSKWDC